MFCIQAKVTYCWYLLSGMGNFNRDIMKRGGVGGKAPQFRIYFAMLEQG